MADEEDQAGPSTSPRTGVKLFLGGLSWETTEDKITSYFKHFGEIVEVIVMRDAATKKPRGFGFIIFKDPDVADLVCSQQHTLDGRQIDAKKSVPPEQKPRSKKIFVGGLAPDTTSGTFQEYFAQFGTVADAQIMQDHLSGRSRGFGFITFEDDSAVEQVFKMGNMHTLAGKQVEVKTATPRGSGPVGGRGGSQAGWGTSRAAYPGRGTPGYEGAEMDPSQAAAYPMAGYAGMPRGYPGMMPGYPMGYQAPFPYGNMMVNPYAAAYGYPQQFAGYQLAQGAFDPRQQAAYPFPVGQPGRAYNQALAPRPAQRQQNQQPSPQQQSQQQPPRQQR